MSWREWVARGLENLRARDLRRAPRVVDSADGLRGTVDGREAVLFCTNDYLGLSGHPAVREAAVIGIPDDRWGEAVVAVVSLRSRAEAGEQDLIRFVRERLADFKTPKAIHFVSELPKTGTGKIAKRVLRGSLAR